MPKIFSYKTLLFIFLCFFVLFVYSKIGLNHWQIVASVDKPQLANQWQEAQKVSINTNGWESGPYISGNGQTLFYAYYPGDLIGDSLTGKLKDDVDIFYSEKPFTKSQKHNLSEDNWSEGGMMIAGSDIYYMSNRYRQNTYDLYKNGYSLFDTIDKSEKDPHYCQAKAELYFEIAGFIYVYKNDKSTALPFPINDNSYNSQPFLTINCEEIYFVSTGGDGVSKILKSQRIADSSWSEPEIVVSSKYGVGDPSLTDDGKIIFFVQFLKSAKDQMNADIFYAEKVEN